MNSTSHLYHLLCFIWRVITTFRVQNASCVFRIFPVSWTRDTTNSHARQCACNIILWRVRTFVSRNETNIIEAAMETQQWVLFCIVQLRTSPPTIQNIGTQILGLLRHNAFHHLRSVWLSRIFRNYLVHSTIFGKNILITKCEFCFLYYFYQKHISFQEEISVIFSWSALGSSRKAPDIFVRLQSEATFPPQILIKVSITKFHENPSNVELLHTDRRAGRETWRN